MQTKIFFFSPSGTAPLENIRNLAGWHSWTPDGKGYAFGVATPSPGVDPMEVVGALTANGAYVLPSYTIRQQFRQQWRQRWQATASCRLIPLFNALRRCTSQAGIPL